MEAKKGYFSGFQKLDGSRMDTQLDSYSGLSAYRPHNPSSGTRWNLRLITYLLFM